MVEVKSDVDPKKEDKNGDSAVYVDSLLCCLKVLGNKCQIECLTT